MGGMIPEKVFQEILILGERWEVFAVDYDKDQSKVFIRVRETARLWPAEHCPKCNAQSVTGYDHVPERHWRHLNVCQLQSTIVCSLPRGQCRDCKAVFQVKPPWEGRSKHFTQEFEGFALLLAREMPVSKAGEILGETDQRLWRMLFAHVQAAHAQLSMEQVVWVGADEMNRKKGHHYLTVFVDLLAKRVLFATEGKDATTWEAFAKALLEHNGHPKAVTQVAIDMSPAYRKGVVENFGNACVSFDKFHVVGQVVEAVDEVRRAERSEPDRGDLLEKARWLFRKNPENWTDKEGARWEELAGENLATGLAYQMRLVFQGIYKLGCAKLARKKFQSWCEWVEQAAAEAGKLLEPMMKRARMVREHLDGIMGHWKDGLTTAYLEGLNSLFSATKRKARGYRSTEHLITMLYFVAGKLSIPCY
jgi:transposase